jgi:hypothetical protein
MLKYSIISILIGYARTTAPLHLNPKTILSFYIFACIYFRNVKWRINELIN